MTSEKLTRSLSSVSAPSVGNVAASPVLVIDAAAPTPQAAPKAFAPVSPIIDRSARSSPSNAADAPEAGATTSPKELHLLDEPVSSGTELDIKKTLAARPGQGRTGWRGSRCRPPPHQPARRLPTRASPSGQAGGDQPGGRKSEQLQTASRHLAFAKGAEVAAEPLHVGGASEVVQCS